MLMPDTVRGPRMQDWLSGNCEDLADAFTYICRALGIPSGCDEMLMRGDNNVPHYWNFVPDDYCDAFFCSLLYPGPLAQSHIYDAPRGKVYRRMFSINRNMVKRMNQPPENIHPIFRYPLMLDVTDIYSDCEQMITVPESRFLISPERDEIIYLCLPSHMEWMPVAVSKCKDGQVVSRMLMETLSFACPFIVMGNWCQ